MLDTPLVLLLAGAQYDRELRFTLPAGAAVDRLVGPGPTGRIIWRPGPENAMVQRRRAFRIGEAGANFSTRRALLLLGTALFMGVAADFLARTGTDRLNLAIWIMLALLAALLLARRGVVQVPRQSYVLAGAALLFAAGLAGRDAEAIFAVDLLAALSLIVLGAPQPEPGRLRAAGLTHYARAAFESAVGAIFSDASRGREGHRVGHGAGQHRRGGR